MILRAEPLAEQVYRQLKERILNGSFQSGERIVESRLAMELQVSRSPVREAIRMLVAEQLLHVKKGYIHVFEPSIEDFKQIYELRMAIETAAAELAAPYFDEKSRIWMETNLTATRQAVDNRNIHELVDLNTAFHSFILELCGNHRFKKIMNEVSEWIRYYWPIVLRMNSLQTDIYEEHYVIYQAFDHNDGRLAAEKMKEHIGHDLKVINDHFIGK